MKKLLLLSIVLAPLLINAQQPNMHIKLFFGFNGSELVYRAENVESDLLGGVQIGGGFRVKYRESFGEIDFGYMIQVINFSPREEDNLPIEEDVELTLGSLDIPIVVGYVPIKTPLFGCYLYGGIANRLILNGRIYYMDEEYKFNPKDAKLHVYNLGARFGVQFDIAMFNFDFNYTIGVTNSFRDRTRTNSHAFMFNLGFLF